MKHLSLSLLVVAVLLGACTSKPANSYTVKGTLPDSTLVGEMLYIIRQDDNKKIDSLLSKSTDFTFTGVVDTASFCVLQAGKGYYGQFVLEPGEITLDLAEGKASDATPLNKLMNAFIEQMDSLAKEHRSKTEEFKKTTQDETELAKLSNDYYENEFKPKFETLLHTTFLANPDNVIGLQALEMYFYEFQDKADELLAKAGPQLKATKSVKRMIQTSAALKNTAEGMQFTDFTIEQEDGSKASLSDYVGKGKYVLVDFWASWCGPCVREIPVIKEVYEKYKKQGLDVVSVAVWDKPEDTKLAIEKHGLPWHQIINAQKIPTDLYGISGIPHIILFSPEGKILARNLRGDGLKAAVAEAMGK